MPRSRRQTKKGWVSRKVAVPFERRPSRTEAVRRARATVTNSAAVPYLGGAGT
jgi:hypothetical protein